MGSDVDCSGHDPTMKARPAGPTRELGPSRDPHGERARILVEFLQHGPEPVVERRLSKYVFENGPQVLNHRILIASPCGASTAACMHGFLDLSGGTLKRERLRQKRSTVP